jgi:TRAP-type transport system periplasmic protein
MRRHLSSVLACAVLVACSPPSGADKAGPPGSAPVTLDMAIVTVGTSVAPSVGYFAARVAALSHGNLRIKIHAEWGEFGPDAEAQVVQASASGGVDLGWIGTRVFDTLGVPSFRALSAPMLIDSNETVKAVLASSIPGQMMRGLRRVNVTGLAVFGDGMRFPVAVKHPLRSPADWRGITFGTFRSSVQEQAIRSLGARPKEVLGLSRGAALDTGQIQGYEFDPWTYSTQASAAKAPYFTANIALWPQTEVLIANPNTLRSLTGAQRGWLSQAAAQTSRLSVDLTRPSQVELRNACAVGARFVEASTADQAEMRSVFSTVYQSLEADPDTKVFLDEIRRITSTHAAGPLFRVPAQCDR